ncbi:MFS transporter [Paenibacillus sp. S150]|uniref:MFS transporter n=1 Tax=Paenibacillus sp. S150 TaxID=2749826 RepID=UPI001C5966E0|nr:MFS transporter [Paenibacillus sp. S150]MBW4085714.1 MFS transporter [Paenibacillus sp. S150]
MKQIKENPAEKIELNQFLIFLMSIASAICAANLYYAQPLLSNLSAYFHVSSTVIGISATIIQIGFAIGLIFIVPLGDMVNQRSLIIVMLICSMVALLELSFATNIIWFTIGSLFVGITSIAQMVLVTLAAHLANPASRGRIIGTVMTGLLIGMQLSRTFSGIIGTYYGWQVVYQIASVMIGILIIIFYFYLPQSSPGTAMSYGKLIASLGSIVRNQPILRSSSLIGAMMFASFSAFWTTLSFLLKSPVYNLGAQTAGILGLIGAVGAIAASIAGRVVDKKGYYFTLTIGISLSIAGFMCFWILGDRMWGLIFGIILLSVGVQTAQISNQAKINTLDAALRSRNNGVYMAFYFIGGAIGSFLGSYFWGLSGWTGVCILGITFQIIAAVTHFFGVKHTTMAQN